MLPILHACGALLNACILSSTAIGAGERDLSDLLRPDALVVLEIPDVAAARTGMASAPLLGPWLRSYGDERHWDAEGPGPLDYLGLLFAPTVHRQSLEALGPEVQVLMEGLRAFEGQVVLGMSFEQVEVFFDTETDESGPALQILIGEYADAEDFVVDTLVPMFGAEFEPLEQVHHDLTWWSFDFEGGDRMALAGTDELLLLVYSDCEIFEAELEELSAALATGEPRGLALAVRDFETLPAPLMRITMPTIPLDLPDFMAAKARKSLGKDPSTAVTAGLHLGAQRMGIESATDWSWARALSFDEDIFGPAPLHLLSGASAPWTSAFAIHLDLERLIAWSIRVAVDSGMLTDMDLDSALDFGYATLSQALGVDVRSDLLELMNGEIACVGLPADQLHAEGPVAMLHAVGFGVFLIGSDEPAFLADALLDVLVFQGLAFTEQSADDAQWYELELGLGLPLCIGSRPGSAVIAFGREGLLAALGSKGTGQPALLRDLEEGLEAPTAVWILDLDQVLDPLLESLDLDAEVGEFLAELPAGARLMLTQTVDGEFWRHALQCRVRPAK